MLHRNRLIFGPGKRRHRLLGLWRHVRRGALLSASTASVPVLAPDLRQRVQRLCHAMARCKRYMRRRAKMASLPLQRRVGL